MKILIEIEAQCHALGGNKQSLLQLHDLLDVGLEMHQVQLAKELLQLDNVHVDENVLVLEIDHVFRCIYPRKREVHQLLLHAVKSLFLFSLRHVGNVNDSAEVGRSVVKLDGGFDDEWIEDLSKGFGADGVVVTLVQNFVLRHDVS